MHFQLISANGSIVAEGTVVLRDHGWIGTIDLEAMPSDLRKLFDEYEQIVEGQVFSLLDELEQRIADSTLFVELEGEGPVAATELQIYPSTGRVSFTTIVPSSATSPGRSE